MKTFAPLTILTGLALVIPQLCFGWGNAGHEAVVAVALEFKPELRAQLEGILKDLPASQKWKGLETQGLKPHNPFQTEKKGPGGWIKALADEPEKAATFPGWARDYKDYTHDKYDKWHFYDLDYEDADDKRFVEEPNALSVLVPFENDLKTKTGGDRAWALVWILHIVGDLHQPLHCCSRALPDDENKSDNGGNGVNYEGRKLHSFW